eukprot:Skav212623  [mRNA]  locus=scaffold173:129862:131358:- [translate_table: standard]
MRRARKKASKQNFWPDIYWAQIPLKDKATNDRIITWYPFLLPHEWMADVLAQPGALQACLPNSNSKVALAFHTLCANFGLPVQGTIPFGLHGDAVPVLGTIRKASMDFITTNLPTFCFWQERVPFTVLQTKYIFEQETKDAIWEIFLWSATCLKNGTYPIQRHDGDPWLRSDKKRSQSAGMSLPVKGILCEVRGDWDWYNSWLQCPTWNTKRGMCWLCHAKPDNFKELLPEERQRKKTRTTFVEDVSAAKKQLFSFWKWPEMAPSTVICPDWLHSMDQGVGADICGMLLVEIANACEGRTFKLRVANLWQEIRQLYTELKVEYKLANLTPEILNKGKKPTGPPTLKGPAAQVRHFVPLLPILANRHLDPNILHQLACQKLARFLAQTYAAMETNDVCALKKAGQKMAQQYKELEKEALQVDPDDMRTWHIMPKLHLCQHLCEMGFPVKDFWTYKDETMGGSLAKLFKRRGGKDNPSHNALEVLDRWKCTNAFPLFKQK